MFRCLQLLGCLANLLRLQDRVVWNDSSTLYIYGSILPFAIHNKSKVSEPPIPISSGVNGECLFHMLMLCTVDTKSWSTRSSGYP